MKVQHQQVEVDRSQTLTEFIKEDGVDLTHGIQYMLTTFIDLYLIGQGRVICDNDPIVSMLTFLISLNSMSISLIADNMS
jgi:hypothetical protein